MAKLSLNFTQTGGIAFEAKDNSVEISHITPLKDNATKETVLGSLSREDYKTLCNFLYGLLSSPPKPSEGFTEIVEGALTAALHMIPLLKKGQPYPKQEDKEPEKVK